MSRTVYSIEELVKSRTSALLLTTCVIDHPTFATPIALVANPVSISNGLIRQGEGSFPGANQFTLDSKASRTNDYYNGLTIRIDSVDHTITDYDGATRTVSVASLASVSDVTFSIIGALTPFAFNFIPQSEGENSILTAQITLDNVDRSVTEYVRNVNTPLQLSFWVFNTDSPYIMEMGPLYYTLRDISYNRQQLSGTLYVKTGVTQNIGKWSYTNVRCPGLYG